MLDLLFKTLSELTRNRPSSEGVFVAPTAATLAEIGGYAKSFTRGVPSFAVQGLLLALRALHAGRVRTALWRLRMQACGCSCLKAQIDLAVLCGILLLPMIILGLRWAMLLVYDDRLAMGFFMVQARRLYAVVVRLRDLRRRKVR